MIHREEKRLSLIFKHALLLGAAACGSTRTTKDASTDDATVMQSDGSTVGDAGVSDAADEGPCALQPYIPVAGDLCADFFRLPCGMDAAPRGNCYFSYEDCVKVCPEDFFYNC